jgi:hypothetical protein
MELVNNVADGNRSGRLLFESRVAEALQIEM